MDLLPLPLKISKSLDGEKKADYVKKLHAKVHLSIEKRNEQRTRQVNKGRKQILFEPGDWVWVHMRKERFPEYRKNKLHPRGDCCLKVECAVILRESHVL